MIEPMTIRLTRFIVAMSILALSAKCPAESDRNHRELGAYHGKRSRRADQTHEQKGAASATLISYGAIVTNLLVPDKDGKLGDVVLGFDSVQEYEQAGPFLGCIPGRFANRLATGMFTLDGVNYARSRSTPAQTRCMADSRDTPSASWEVRHRHDAGRTGSVRNPFTLVDWDGTEGFTGTVKVTVYYTLTQDNTLKIQYYATTDKATPINLTHHSYFNLRGDPSTDVLGYVAKSYADKYLPVDATRIPSRCGRRRLRERRSISAKPS